MTVLFLSLRLNSGEKSFFHLKQANRDLVITSHNVSYVAKPPIADNQEQAQAQAKIALLRDKNNLPNLCFTKKKWKNLI